MEFVTELLGYVSKKHHQSILVTAWSHVETEVVIYPGEFFPIAPVI